MSISGRNSVKSSSVSSVASQNRNSTNARINTSNTSSATSAYDRNRASTISKTRQIATSTTDRKTVSNNIGMRASINGPVTRNTSSSSNSTNNHVSSFQSKLARDEEEMKKQFKAKPAPKNILMSRGELGVPRVQPKKVTVPKGFDFHTSTRRASSKVMKSVDNASGESSSKNKMLNDRAEAVKVASSTNVLSRGKAKENQHFSQNINNNITSVGSNLKGNQGATGNMTERTFLPTPPNRTFEKSPIVSKSMTGSLASRRNLVTKNKDKEKYNKSTTLSTAINIAPPTPPHSSTRKQIDSSSKVNINNAIVEQQTNEKTEVHTTKHDIEILESTDTTEGKVDTQEKIEKSENRKQSDIEDVSLVSLPVDISTDFMTEMMGFSVNPIDGKAALNSSQVKDTEESSVKESGGCTDKQNKSKIDGKLITNEKENLIKDMVEGTTTDKANAITRQSIDFKSNTPAMIPREEREKEILRESIDNLNLNLNLAKSFSFSTSTESPFPDEPNGVVQDSAKQTTQKDIDRKRVASSTILTAAAKNGINAMTSMSSFSKFKRENMPARISASLNSARGINTSLDKSKNNTANVTKAIPFNLSTEKRGKMHESIFKNRVEEEREKEELAREVYALPCPDFDEINFEAKGSDKPLTQPEAFKLEGVLRRESYRKSMEEKLSKGKMEFEGKTTNDKSNNRAATRRSTLMKSLNCKNGLSTRHNLSKSMVPGTTTSNSSTRASTATAINERPSYSKNEVKTSSPAVKRSPLVARSTISTTANLRDSSSKALSSPREKSAIRTSIENVSITSNIKKTNVSKSLAFGSPVPDISSRKLSTTPKMLTCPEPFRLSVSKKTSRSSGGNLSKMEAAMVTPTKSKTAAKPSSITPSTRRSTLTSTTTSSSLRRSAIKANRTSTPK